MNNKTKTILYLTIGLILLVTIFIFWQNPLNQQASQDNSETILTKSLDNVAKIEITKDNKTTLLQKSAEGGENDNWLVVSANNAEANPEYVNKLINSLKQIKTGTTISQNPEKLITFELGEGMGMMVKLSDNQNNVLLELQVGKMGPAYTQTYVRKPDNNKVLLINQNLLLSLTPNSWVKPPETNTNTNATQ